MIAAIDTGSNAIRLAVAKAEARGRLQIVETLRVPLRLGSDAFEYGLITPETEKQLIAVFQQFRTILEKYEHPPYRAVATSALRESNNGEEICDNLFKQTGIRLERIDELEEARLIHLAVSHKIPLSKLNSMIVDIGGGSVEVILSSKGKIVAADSFRLGAVRLLKVLEEPKYGETNFYQLVKEYTTVVRRWVRKEIGHKKIELFIGTGGSNEALADLRAVLFKKNSTDRLLKDELGIMVEQLQRSTPSERISRFQLRPDRADVIVPAAIVMQILLELTRAKEILIPRTGLRDGILLELNHHHFPALVENKHDLVCRQALQIAKRFNADEKHIKQVAHFAKQLFDHTAPLHRLSEPYRLYLEVASILHDIGHFIHSSSHHKHSQYIIEAIPMVSLSEYERKIIGNIARYHRKSSPSLSHESYRELLAHDRDAVIQLCSLLRIADALDREHESKVHHLTVELKKNGLYLTIEGEDDLLLEQWAVKKKSTLFEQVFSIPVIVQKKEVF
ncbi:MAG: Ppx/GppA family phosphatase [bacterium]|nr:Ppx/GppA family phosphatase [bacterium]